MTDEEHIVAILKKFNRPVGWYPIAQTLVMRGVILSRRLPDVLDKLILDKLIKVTEENRYEMQ